MHHVPAARSAVEREHGEATGINDDSRLGTRPAPVLAFHPARRVRVDGALRTLSRPHSSTVSPRGVRPRDAARADQRTDLSLVCGAEHAVLGYRFGPRPALPRA